MAILTCLTSYHFVILISIPLMINDVEQIISRVSRPSGCLWRNVYLGLLGIFLAGFLLSYLFLYFRN